MKMHRTPKRQSVRGNTLAEYALPIALIVVVSGVIASSVNIQKLIPAFFAKASGAQVSGTSVVAKSMGQGAAGGVGNGGGGFGNISSNGAMPGGIGGRAEPTIDVSGGMGNMLAQLEAMNSTMGAKQTDGQYQDASTYVAMVKDLSMSTLNAKVQSQATGGSANNQLAAALAAKQNAIAQFAQAHTMQVLTNGGSNGLASVQLSGNNATNTLQTNGNVAGNLPPDSTCQDQALNGTTCAGAGSGTAGSTGGTGTMTTTQAQDATQPGLNQLLTVLNFYDNIMYQPIENNVFTAWRQQTYASDFNNEPFTIYGMDVTGDVGVLTQTWGSNLNSIGTGSYTSPPTAPSGPVAPPAVP